MATHIPEDDFNENMLFGEQSAPPHPLHALQQQNNQRPPAPFVPPLHMQQPPQRPSPMMSAAPAAFEPPPGMGMPPSFPETEFMSPAEALGAAMVGTAPPSPVDPLARYYRTPGLTVMLPTRGAFFAPHDYSPALNQEIPIYPMRAQDELLMKNPDALMSGYAIEELLRSCAPAIKNPRKISSPDLDVLLLAIRAASYGENMEIEVTCPACDKDHTFDCHLPSVMSNMTYVDAQNPVQLAHDLIVYVRPYTLETATTIALTSYEEGRKVQIAADPESGQDLQAARNMAFRRLSALNTNAMINAIIAIDIPEGRVTDPMAIGRFIANVDRSMTSKIEKKLRDLNNMGIDKTLSVRCLNEECNHEWETEIEFNPASFFAQGS